MTLTKLGRRLCATARHETKVRLSNTRSHSPLTSLLIPRCRILCLLSPHPSQRVLTKPISRQPVALAISASDYNNLVRVASLIPSEPCPTSLPAPSLHLFCDRRCLETNDSGQICAFPSQLSCIRSRVKKLFRSVQHSLTNTDFGRESALPSTKTFLGNFKKACVAS
jgi:hypothetical protein